MARSVPRSPAGLGEAGLRLWRSVHAALGDGVELDERETLLVELAARQIDDVARLEATLERDGMMIEGSRGQSRLHPAAGEVRQARLAVARLLSDQEQRKPVADQPVDEPTDPLAEVDELAARRQRGEAAAG